MAKTSAIQKNLHRKEMIKQYAKRMDALRETSKDKSISVEERYKARQKLGKMPRNANPTRFRNRCLISGRPRGFHRKFEMSRIAIRDLGGMGLITGLIKSSW